MTTTVRIREMDKTELNKFQATILLRTGKKITHDQILHYLLRYAKDSVLESIIDDVNDQQIDWDKIQEGIDDYGSTDASKVDEVVYGDL